MPLALCLLLDEVQKKVVVPEAIEAIVGARSSSAGFTDGLIAAIESDQAVASDILRVINSSYYSVFTESPTVRAAVFHIGPGPIRQLAIGLGIMRALDGIHSDASSSECFWKHSIYCAILAEYLSYEVDSGLSEAAFSAGLLHDIGLLLISSFLPREAQSARKLAAQSRGGCSLEEAEQTLLGFNHSKVGFEIASLWGLPSYLCECLQSHHSPDRAQNSPEVTALVHIANSITAYEPVFDHCSDSGRPYQSAWDTVNLGSEIVPDVVAEAQQQYRLLQALLNM